MRKYHKLEDMAEWGLVRETLDEKLEMNGLHEETFGITIPLGRKVDLAHDHK